jgi:hypothetical protein
VIPYPNEPDISPALAHERGKFHTQDVLETPPLDLSRPLERGALVVRVGVVALQVGGQGVRGGVQR